MSSIAMSDFDMAVDEHDWMEDQDDQTPGTSAQPVAVSKFHLHEPVTGPKQDEAEKIREQKKASGLIGPALRLLMESLLPRPVA